MKQRFILGTILVLACTMFAVAVAARDSSQKADSANLKNAGTSAASAGGYYTNGQAAKRNPDGTLALPEALQEAVSTSHEGLEGTLAPGGGEMVDLKGRFQSLSVLVLDAEGNPTVSCVSDNRPDVCASHAPSVTPETQTEGSDRP